MLREEVGKLRRAYESMQHKMQDESSAPAKFIISKMECGSIQDFHLGLGARVGEPHLDFGNAMEAEHCRTKGSKICFTTRNYKVTTCAYNEWQIAVKNNTRLADMRCGKRRIPEIEELLELSVVKDANLWREEVIAVVLYTGPMYERYNCILRQWPRDVYKAMVEQGSMFTTTIYALVSAVQKLASAIKMPDGLKLYRGLGGVCDLPDSFFKAHTNGARGFTEWGFMSTTSDKDVAVYYSSKVSQRQVSLPIVLELTVSAVDRGARIKELSQYPGEVEYLWVPCSFVAPDGPERMEVTEHHGVVRIVPVRVNSNLTTQTLEQIINSKKHTLHSAGLLQRGTWRW
jgi:hypothetical protein